MIESYLCRLDELENGRPRCFRVEGVDVLVVRDGERLYATQNRCGHAGAALHLGEYTDGLIVCPLHGAAFHIDTGAVEWEAIIPPPMATYRLSEDARIRKFGELLEGIETLPIKTFPVTLREGAVYTQIEGNRLK